MLAAAKGHLECVQTLLNLGAKTHLRNKKREKALDLATAGKHQAVMTLLQTHDGRGFFNFGVL